MTDITSPIHNRADVDLVDRLRAAVSTSRGLTPRDYSHFVPRPVAQTKKSPTGCTRSGLSAA